MTTPVNIYSEVCRNSVALVAERLRGSPLEAGLAAPWMRSLSPTLLFSAAIRGHIPVAELLLSHGVDVNETNQLGHTALDGAKAFGQTTMATMLTGVGARTGRPVDFVVSMRIGGKSDAASQFLWACAGNEATRVRQYVNEDRKMLRVTNDFDQADSGIHLAARYGHLEVVRALLDAGMDAAEENGYDETPWVAAFQEGQALAMALLVPPKEQIWGVSGTGSLATIARLLPPTH